MSFLEKGYELPATPSSYTKLEKGETKLRILSDAITGYEYWNTDNKPVRSKKFPQETPGIRIEEGQQSRIKHFWAMVVWNYNLKQVQIWQVAQKSIQEKLIALLEDEDWGDPKSYDLKITRTGERLETKYNVNPTPKKEVGEDIANAYKAKPVNLNELFDGGDPFGGDSGEVADEDNPFADEPF